MLYTNKKYIADIGPDSVAIYDTSGEELLYWDMEEWREDPSVAVAVANAIAMALSRPEEFEIYLRQSVCN